jgi:type IV pilus assembly protein PilM
MNIPVEEAEEHKRVIDISASGGAGMGQMGGMPDPARQVTLPFVDELVRELRRSIIYFQSQAAEAGMAVAVEHLVLAGGGTQLPGLPDYLRERLGMTVSILDPLAVSGGQRGAAANWEGRGPELAVAVGLALKEYN